MAAEHKPRLTRELVAMRVAQELAPGSTVNLGVGMPTLVAAFAPPDANILLQSENGILGYGGFSEEAYDQDLVNAGGQPITLNPGASFFDSAASFAMIRGGHIDTAVLGGLQVSERGDLANWSVPERGGGSIGGAMDLAVGARRLIVAMEHTTKDGRPRLLRECTYPLTARGCVDLIVTDLAVVEVGLDGLTLREVAPGWAPGEVVTLTDAPLTVPRGVPEMEL
ncbi:MAG: 3-oxoacid CoA-transferase subunit B [Dehalococcoidia bacterium]|nr:3-oxoacid CoA-transferase subunit B [Dehalococcoidia bacterium]